MNDILIVDDKRDIREMIADILRDEGLPTRLAGTSEDCLREIDAEPPGLLILDIWLKESQMDGIDILKVVRRDNPDIPVVIISGHGNIEVAVAAIKQGAYDFIEKPFNISQLLTVVHRAMELSRLRHENSELRRRDLTSAEMVGTSPAIRDLHDQLEKVKNHNGRVMLTGPSGSGKEVAARHMHAISKRAKAPFVTVPCATLEPERMDGTLFGHEMSGSGIQQGLLERAHGGTIFLDEVADLPLGAQPRILRVLAEQQFQRVGGSTRVRVDLRVVSSTSRDLVAEIAAGRFREDLYHRLNAVPIMVPPLDRRREDIPELARHFIARLHETEGLPLRTLSDGAMSQLQSMPWPGNARQLRNMLERVLILGAGEDEIAIEEVVRESPAGTLKYGVTLSPELVGMTLRDARDVFEREYLSIQLDRFAGNVSRAAEHVGMERSALHRKLKSLAMWSGSG